MDDLKRWGIAHINLTGQKLGRHVLGTAYETEKAMMLLILESLVIIRKSIRYYMEYMKERARQILTMDVLLQLWLGISIFLRRII